MNFNSEYISYQQTNSFSKIVLDYLNNDDWLKKFYTYSQNESKILKIIENKKAQNTNRELLVNAIKNSYKNLETKNIVNENIEKLLLPNSYSICTAHQPNIFTGHLYFIYKIIHTIKLAADLQKKYNDFNFIPIYYMGSEDADFDELGHINIGNEN